MRPTILSAIFYEASTYDDQFGSAFETHFDRDVGDRLMSMSGGGLNINANTLAGAVGDAIKVQSKATQQIYIPGGFGERRLSFIITVLISGSAGYEQRQVLTGYTDYFGINTFQGSIDEDMMLYVNNSIILRDTPHTTARGSSNRVFVESNEYILRNGSQRNRSVRFNDNVDRMVRPVDIFNSQGVSEIQRAMGGADEYIDTRADLGSEIKLGHRLDNNPADYLSRTLKAGIMAEFDNGNEWNPDSRFAEQPETKSNLAAGAVNVAKIEDNVLFMNFLDACEFQQEGAIRISEMRDCVEWPESYRGQSVTRIITRSEVEKRDYTSYDRGQGNRLNGADQESIAARIIARSLPAILMSHHICDAMVEFSNDTVTGEMKVIVYNERPLVPGADISGHIIAVEEKVRVQVANPVSRNNQMLVTVRVDCSAITDVKIWVSLEGREEEFYCYPMHCDGLTSPQKTNDYDLAAKISNDLGSTIQDMTDGIYARQDSNARKNGPRDVWNDGGHLSGDNMFG